MSEQTQDKIGKLLDGTEERDAIHVAVAPARAGELLNPGERVDVKFDDEGAFAVNDPMTSVGVVDPFLSFGLDPGDRFFVFLYPNTVTGMRHHWSHPAFDGAEAQRRPKVSGDKAESERWLREFCENHDCPDYETVMKAIKGEDPDAEITTLDFFADELLLHFRGVDAHASIPPEFWDHVEVVLGEKIPQNDRATKFSCAC